MIDDDLPLQHLTITLELPGGPGTNTIAMHAVLTVLDRLECDGLRPYRTTISITEQPTTSAPTPTPPRPAASP